jgi:hypothetical protein
VAETTAMNTITAPAVNAAPTMPLANDPNIPAPLVKRLTLRLAGLDAKPQG